MLEQHAEGLWTLDAPAKLLGLDLGIRMTVVRLRDGGLWLHSPVPLTDAHQRELEALGPVRFIVAPSQFHHLHARGAKERFPKAKLLGAPGLPEKRKRLAFDGVLGATPDPGYGADLRHHVIGGMPAVNEVAFLHLPSRTLIVTDALFHVPHPRTWVTRMFMKWNGKNEGLCQTRVYGFMIRDRAAFRASMRHIAAWDFDRIIMSHGDVVPAGGKAGFLRAVAWLA